MTERSLPGRIDTEAELEAFLTRPNAGLQDFVRKLPSPLLILGAGGKMGPSLAILAKRAAEAAGHPLQIIAVSRFGDKQLVEHLRRNQIETISCNLMDPAAVARLPDAPNLLYLVGLKFGTTDNPSATWAINTIVPTRIAERYGSARIVALSTGNVYPPTATNARGATENHVLTPLGEYANSAVARERIFEFHSRNQGTPVVLLRLFYAVELRYGVLVDIARRVHSGEPIDLANGYFNCIWQGDANDMAIRALELATSPPTAWNLCRPEIFSVREVAGRVGELLGRAPSFTGRELPTALIGDSSSLCSKLGEPSVPLESMLNWIAGWVRGGGRDLHKPTHFESRDGQY
jgi:nucleoside-diphosphate-sugar epimerase